MIFKFDNASLLRNIISYNRKLTNDQIIYLQLAELHVYLIPRKAWRGNRNLAEKNVAEASMSVGFVR